MTTAQASIGSQNCWSKSPRGMSISRGNGRASVPHSIAVALQHRPHRNDFSDEAEHGAADEDQDKADGERQSHSCNEQRTQHAAEHPERAGRKAEHARGGVHHIIGDADQCVDAADGEPGEDDRLDHRCYAMMSESSITV
jgi:hypothetical protein